MKASQTVNGEQSKVTAQNKCRCTTESWKLTGLSGTAEFFFSSVVNENENEGESWKGF